MKARLVKAVKIVAMQDVESIRYSRKRDEFEVRYGFFYRHGNTAAKYCEKVREYIPGIEIMSFGERWQPWPKDSYWWVTFKVVDVDAIMAKIQEIRDAYGKTLEELYQDTKAYIPLMKEKES